MVEAVAMRTTGLGGDSEIHLVTEGLDGGLRLGPRRLVPVSLLAVEHGPMVHAALDRALASETPGEHDGRFVLPGAARPAGLAPREAGLLARIDRPMPLAQALSSRLESAALERLVARGAVMLSGATPSDASHVLGGLAAWDGAAAEKAMALLARRRTGAGERFAPDAAAMARAAVDRLTAQTAEALLEAAFAEDPAFAGLPPADLARHPLLRAGLVGHTGVVALTARLGVPVVGLGASAPAYYGAVGRALGCEMILPAHADVANAIGAVAGQVRQSATGLVTQPAEGRFAVHLPSGVSHHASADEALAVLDAALTEAATTRALAAGAVEVTLTRRVRRREAEIEGRRLLVEAEMTVTASGRPRVAHGPAGGQDDSHLTRRGGFNTTPASG
jgi:N-methylhydantoinase A/oxoprolinase/acetone carboxylase beta subunit